MNKKSSAFSGPRLTSCVASRTTEIQGHRQGCCARRGGPRTPSKIADTNLDRAFVENALFYTYHWLWKVYRKKYWFSDQTCFTIRRKKNWVAYIIPDWSLGRACDWLGLAWTSWRGLGEGAGACGEAWPLPCASQSVGKSDFLLTFLWLQISLSGLILVRLGQNSISRKC